jgi:hypothetical protein
MILKNDATQNNEKAAQEMILVRSTTRKLA